MKAFGCAPWAPIRMRSPSTAPPLIGLDGSTAITAIFRPSASQRAEQRIDERRLAAARHAGDADDPGAAGARRPSAPRPRAPPGRRRRSASAGGPARAGRRRARARRARRCPTAVIDASDDDERLAEAEVAAQPAADLLVASGRPARPRRPRRTRCRRSLSVLRVSAVERLLDRGARARRLRGGELVEMAAHRDRVGALDRRAAAGLVVGLVLVDADDDLLAARRRGPGCASPRRRSSAAPGPIRPPCTCRRRRRPSS